MKSRCPQTGQMIDFDELNAAYNKRSNWPTVTARQAEIARIIARYQLEPDEMQSAEQKAEQYL